MIKAKKEKSIKGTKSDDELKKLGKSGDKLEGIESIDLTKMSDANLASSPIPKNENSTSQNVEEFRAEVQNDLSNSLSTSKEHKLTDIIIKR
jgi:hypothetical protein